ncbi:MAG: DNA ligase D [Chitinophagaceae bacterium]|nr:MAG: DNA ligase D [Chitinophagaceae bacterium]
MLASPGGDAFDDKDWLYEIKWDGYRAIAECSGKTVELYSRNGLSFKEKYPDITTGLGKIKHRAVLDGEIVFLDKTGNPSFQKLQQYEDKPEGKLLYYVFDLLFLDKKDLRHLALTDRKQLLKKLLTGIKEPAIQYNDHVLQNGQAFYAEAIKKNLEGVIAKKADGQYATGMRSKEWLKIKNRTSMEAVIAGYTAPQNSRKHFGSLVLGEYVGKELRYLGHTGTGFDDKSLKELWQKMQPLITTKSPFKTKVRVNTAVTWLRPKLLAEIVYAELTEEGILRHSAFKGLRIDKNISDVKKTTNKSTAGNSKDHIVKIDGRTLTLTNLSKLYWPKEKITKGDLLAYYDSMATYILPHLKDRPLSLKRNPNGILDAGFYHKDAGDQAPTWVKKYEMRAESTNKMVNYIVCNNKPTLLYIANLGSIEINPWNSTTRKVENPTYMIIDIDPSDKNTFDDVIETALVVKKILDKAGVESYCKTSGATGLHVYVPTGGKYPYEKIRQFGEIVASLTVEQLPGITSVERSLKKRGNKIYVDFLQNSKGQTLAAAYSVRPKAGATVSTPLLWKEVKKGLHPSNFNIHNIQKRVGKMGDLFAPVLTHKGFNLQKALKSLEA